MNELQEEEKKISDSAEQISEPTSAISSNTETLPEKKFKSNPRVYMAIKIGIDLKL